MISLALFFPACVVLFSRWTCKNQTVLGEVRRVHWGVSGVCVCGFVLKFSQ